MFDGIFGVSEFFNKLDECDDWSNASDGLIGRLKFWYFSISWILAAGTVKESSNKNLWDEYDLEEVLSIENDEKFDGKRSHDELRRNSWIRMGGNLSEMHDSLPRNTSSTESSSSSSSANSEDTERDFLWEELFDDEKKGGGDTTELFLSINPRGLIINAERIKNEISVKKMAKK